MTNPLESADRAAGPTHVQVYGNDHSPWVQAVLLGLHEKQIPHTLVTVPPLSVFLRSGVLMPAAKIDDEPWQLDSERILVALGFSELEPAERRAMLACFGSGAMRRTDSPWKFWHRFSFARDDHPRLARRLWNHFFRAFSIFYFFSLITLFSRGRAKPSAERLAQQLSYWQERLAPGQRFLGGSTPDTTDLQLFGLVQMYASIPVPSLVTLQRDPNLERLREWIEAMQHRFCQHAHLYSARDFEPRLPEIAHATPLERASFWLGAATMWIALPITLPVALFFARRIRKQGLLGS